MLQALKETDPWDDEDIDEILATADASGDGELQIEDVEKDVEFIHQCCPPAVCIKMFLFAFGILRAR